MEINPATRAAIGTLVYDYARDDSDIERDILKARIETVYWNGCRDGAAHVAAELPKREGA